MTYTELNGARCWVAEDGAGPPLVLLHGGFSDGREFTGNLAGLAGDFRVVRPDRRGHGRSPTSTGRCRSTSWPTTPSRCCRGWAVRRGWRATATARWSRC